MGEIANVCVVIWRGPVTPARFAVQRAGLAEVARRHPGGIGLVCVVEPTAPPPGDDMRRASAQMVRDHQSVLGAIACVVEGTGFVAALGRSVLSAMSLLVGTKKAPMTVVGTVAAASLWIAPRMGRRDGRALEDAIESLRGRLAPWAGGR